MKNSDCYNISIDVENLAIGYTKGAPLGRSYDTWHNNLLLNPEQGWACRRRLFHS